MKHNRYNVVTESRGEDRERDEAKIYWRKNIQIKQKER